MLVRLCHIPSLYVDSAVILNNENSTIHVDAVIDPLSSAGQKLAPLLCVLRKLVHPSMRIVLNPVVRIIHLRSAVSFTGCLLAMYGHAFSCSHFTC